MGRGRAERVLAKEVALACATFPIAWPERFPIAWPESLSRKCSRLGRLRDLADDLDDVAVCDPDPPLTVGAVALREDLRDALELRVTAELTCVGLELPQRAPHQLGDGDAVAAAGSEVHHRRLEPVARGEPLVLRGQNPVVGRDLGADRVAFRIELDQGLAEGRERDGVLPPGHCVADPDLDGAEAWVEADVPPDVRVVRDAAGLLELADDLGVLVVV